MRAVERPKVVTAEKPASEKTHGRTASVRQPAGYPYIVIEHGEPAMSPGEADEVVSAEPRTDCIGPRIIRLEGHAAGIALELYSVPARVKDLATNSELLHYTHAQEKCLSPT